MKTAAKENLELLQSNVKRIIGIIVGLLKDRVSVDSSPASKKARIKKFIKNNMYPGLRSHVIIKKISWQKPVNRLTK
jgi:hypothetical protein